MTDSEGFKKSLYFIVYMFTDRVLLSLTTQAPFCLVSSVITPLHRALISLSLLCESRLFGVVYHQYRISDRAVMAVLFRAENSGQLRYSPLGPKAKLHSLFTCWGTRGTF